MAQFIEKQHAAKNQRAKHRANVQNEIRRAKANQIRAYQRNISIVEDECICKNYVLCRQILDSALIANECLDSRIKSGKPGVVCKIDFAKAFDHVSWEFLYEVLAKMGFGATWRKWDSRLHQQHTNFIYEALNVMFQVGHNRGGIGGFEMSPNGSKISHLQFADDTLVFLDDTLEQMNYLRYTLLGFEMISGLHINFAKCSISGVANASNLEQMDAMLGC
ncbi:uncharacterized protein LOC113315154 [Papaver somniferum]|uniref:uncharacterized protein LOC113315154 n=1 Tax=Papaver somniferum TaxID=3469 RepID=UPI000E6FFEE3|nr:uncharacterized protein LOC113315154 [Papaver somniferum]